MYYKIQVATDSSFKNIVFSALITDGSHSVNVQYLNYYTVYYWRAKSIEPMTGAESPWSSYCSFRTKGADIISAQHSSNAYYISVNNWNRERGNKCKKIGFDLNKLSDTVNYPITSGTCHLIGFDLENLKNRNV